MRFEIRILSRLENKRIPGIHDGDTIDFFNKGERDSQFSLTFLSKKLFKSQKIEIILNPKAYHHTKITHNI